MEFESNLTIVSQSLDNMRDAVGAVLEKRKNLYVEVTKAIGEKCERCWKYRPLGNHDGHSTICDECYEAIKG